MKLPNDRTYSSVLNVGLWMVVGGFFLGAFALLAGASQGKHTGGVVFMLSAGLFIAVFIVGLCVLMYTLASGLGRANGVGSKVPVQCDNVRVIARYAITGLGETLFDETFIDEEDPKVQFYVRLNVPGVGSHEYRCNQIIWAECGESMVGTALIQGNWLGQFVRYIGHGQGNPHLYHVAPQQSGNL